MIDGLTPSDLTGPLMQGGLLISRVAVSPPAVPLGTVDPTGYQSDHLTENWVLAQGRHVPGITPVSLNQNPRVLCSRSGLFPAGREN